MGKITFTPIQEQLFKSITQHELLPKTFYLTGGTALSAVYLHHRESEDLDFFSETDFPDEPLLELINQIAQKLQAAPRFTKIYKSRVFELMKNDHQLIKLDFVHQPFKRIGKGIAVEDFPIDSLLDIGANKLLTINQRTDIKDFVDLYFLLEKFTFWDLLYAAEKKYKMEMDIILISSDFLKIEDFNFLPKMIKPLTLDELKTFFRQKAKEAAMRSIA